MKGLLSLLLVLVIATAVLIPYDQKLNYFIRASTLFQDYEALAEWMEVSKMLGN